MKTHPMIQDSVQALVAPHTAALQAARHDLTTYHGLYAHDGHPDQTWHLDTSATVAQIDAVLEGNGMPIGTDRMFGAAESPYRSIDDFDLPDNVKAYILEYLAFHLWTVGVQTTDGDDYGKSYDPLLIDLAQRTAHSYVFNLTTGARHHPFESLAQLESLLVTETIERINGDRDE